MSTFDNQGTVANQVGGDQNVHGSIYHGNVTYAMQLPPGVNAKSAGQQLEAVHQEILRSLSFSSMLDRRNDIEQPHRNTCQWIYALKEYRDWKDQKCGLLWIKGNPGAGKSTLMSSLHGQTQLERFEQTISLDFFFSANGTELQRTPLGMFRSLLSQLFSKDETIRWIVREQFVENMKMLGRATAAKRGWKWKRRELESLLLETVLSSSKKQPVSIFIDAVDEAGEAFAREITQYFHSLYDHATQTKESEDPSSVKICFACRHYPITSSISGTEIWVEQHNRDDIATFVHDRLNIRQRLSPDADTDTEEWTKLEREVIQHAQGNFQWARLIVPVLEKYLEEAEPLRNVQEVLHQVPKELEDVYEFILKCNINPRHRPQSSCLFHWICFAERTLSITELRYALATDDEAPRTVTDLYRIDTNHDFVPTNSSMRRRIKALSGGLIEVSKDARDPNGPHSSGILEQVQVIHRSVKDFLMRTGLALLCSLQVDTESQSVSANQRSNQRESPDVIFGKGHAKLYWSCLNYMAVKLHEFKVTAACGDFSQQTKQSFPLAAYAVEKIFEHANKAGIYRDSFKVVEIEIWTHVIADWISLWVPLLTRKFWEALKLGTNSTYVAAIGDLEDIRNKLIQQERDPDSHTANHYKKLDCDIVNQYNSLFVATVFVTARRNDNVKSREMISCLVAAAIDYRFSFLRWLLQHWNNASRTTGNLIHHQREASHWGYSSIVKAMLDFEPLINVDTSEHSPAICVAAGSPQETDDVLRTLIDAGADVNVVDRYSATPLYFACSVSSKARVGMLIAAGADVNARTATGGTALHAAVTATFTADEQTVVRMLLDGGADVNAIDDFSYTALHIALQQPQRPSSVQVLRLLIEAGADVNSFTSNDMERPLYTAVDQRWEEAVKLLLNAGADINAGADVNAGVVTNGKAEYSGPALHRAVEMVMRPHRLPDTDYKSILSALLEAGADTNLEGDRGNALQTAAWAMIKNTSAHKFDELEARLREVSTMLLEAGVRVNAWSRRRNTVLQTVTRAKCKRVVELLLDAGADADLAGGHGPSARTIALASGDQALVQLFWDDEQRRRMRRKRQHDAHD